jgi:phosphoglycolate phosphatase-like HAD superfamily hydrolase
MDGVLVDFEKGYYDLTGNHTKQFPKGDGTFWKPLEEAGAAFWANLPWMPDGPQLWRYIKRYKPNILSSPSQDPASRVGKEAWCKMHINNQYKKLYLYSRAYKQMFAGENKILIDDMEQTINEWNKAGGIGIHHTSATNTIAQLKELKL